MINRYFYKSSFKQFIDESFNSIFGALSGNDEGDSVRDQKDGTIMPSEVTSGKRYVSLRLSHIN